MHAHVRTSTYLNRREFDVRRVRSTQVRSRSYRSTHLRRATAAVAAEAAHASGNIVASRAETADAIAVHPRAARLAAALRGSRRAVPGPEYLGEND